MVLPADALARDLAALVRIPSVSGQERAALGWLGRRAQVLGLGAELVEHDLAALRAHAGHPGEEAPAHRAARARRHPARHAAGAATPEVVLQCVAGEEDGGLGAFAAIERDDPFDAFLIPEPTGFAVVCAQAGALTFKGTDHGRGAHAAMRLEGRSAIDRYLAVHRALAAHEERINVAVEHPRGLG